MTKTLREQVQDINNMRGEERLQAAWEFIAGPNAGPYPKLVPKQSPTKSPREEG